ncbi:PKD-like domain-containing protein [Flaviaesturariibacter amylovorans]|uniref:T9SS type A sorting domain-containing protein n=1 Tax=Flaviaesturariibacter amylovorans TaxID=1084520 RepID=A0ABP8H798_9BACT
MRNLSRVLMLAACLVVPHILLATPLSGTYTINASAPASASNFRNIASAVAFLTGTGGRTDGGPGNSAPYGVSGPVQFQMAAGTYNEVVTIGAIAGASSSNTITFQSASGNAADVTITFPGTPAAYSITLNGSSHVQFRNMTFAAGTVSAYRGALLINGCRSVGASGCVFTSPLNNFRGLQFISSASSKSTLVEGSSFNGYLKHLESQGDSGLVVRNNSFTGNGGSNNSVVLGSLSVGRITGNTFQNTNATALEITGGTSTDTFLVNGNKFQSHLGQYTISISHRAFPSDKPGIFQNNFFTEVAREAVYLYYTDNVWLLHNSFSSSNATANTRYVTFIEPYNTVVRNNIFALRGAVPNSGLILYFPYSYTLPGISNNMYLASDTAQYASIRNRDGLARFGDPGYSSPLDLHIQNPCLKTTAIPYVTTDIDGEYRTAAQASYGADEVIPVPNDAAIAAITAPVSPVVSNGASLTFTARVRNSGSAPITSVEAAYTVNGGAPATQTFSGLNIAPCDSALVTFSGTYTVNSEQTTVRVYPVQVNGVAETKTLGDTASRTFYLAMSGTYTVHEGGSGVRNFKRFPEADSALLVRGVNGPVTFELYPGTYLGDSLRNVAGLSAQNPITIKSFSGDTASAIITGKMTVAEGAGYYTLRGLKFTGVPGGWDGAGSGQVSLLRNAHDVLIEQCSFITPPASVCNSFMCSSERTYAVRALNADSAILLRNNKFSGNVFIESAIENPSNNPRPAIATKGVVVRGNRFGSGRGYQYTSYTVYALNVDGAPAAVVDSNFVQDDLVFVRSSGAFRVTRNRIYDHKHLSFQTYIGFIGNLYAYGNATALMVRGDGTPGARALVGNNLIHIAESGGNGLNVQGDHIDVVHNTINDRSDMAPNPTNIYNTTGPSVAASVGGNGTIFKNNIVSGIHTAGTAFKGRIIASTLAPADIDYNGYFSSEPTKNFATLDANNTSTFASWQATGADAHSVFAHPKFRSDTLPRPNQNVFNGAGTGLAMLTFDFENEERHATNPDLGADEFTLPSADAGVQRYVGPARIFPAGPTPVQVVLKNYGTANLTGVTVHWTVNGVPQAPYTWSGVVNYDSLSTPVTIGTYDFPGGKVHDLRFWTTAPNGATDPVPANDTLYQNNIVAALSGTYTVGGATPDFSTFAQVTNALQLGGITGPVTFNIRDGIYNEAFVLKEVSGAGTASRIVFQSESGDSSRVTISQSSAYGSFQGVVTFDGADHISLRKLTVLQSGSYGTGGVVVKNGAHEVMIEQCVLRANNGNYNTTLLVDSTGIDSSLVIRGNRFLFGNMQIDINGNAFQNGVPPQSGLRIVDNRFDSMSARAVQVNAAHGIVVTGNRTFNATSNTPSAYYFTGLSGSSLLHGNSAYGRYQYGIYIANSNSATSDTLRIHNNMIGVGSASGTAYGMYLANVRSTSIYHNTVTAPGNGFVVYLSGITRTHVRNNILQHFGTGNCYYLADFTPDASLVINYNNAFTNGSNVGRVFSTQQTWAQWQAAGRDVAGTNLRPRFLDSLTNLHLNRAFNGLDNTGTPVDVATDFDGEARNAGTPDVGADEFKPYDHEAALVRFDSPLTPFTAGPTDIRVTIRNFGQQPLASAQVHYTINGVAGPVFTFPGTVAYGDSAMNVVIGNYTSVAGRVDTIRVWVSAPNGAADEFNGNDTISGIFLPAFCGTYTVGGTTPDFADLQQASSALSRGGVSCPVILNIRNGEYSGTTQFAAIPGTSALNTVTVQSESGDSSAVVLSTPYDFSFNGYIIRLKGASHIQFKGLTFTRRPFSFYTQGFLTSLILMDSTSGQHISVSNCYFKALGTTMNAVNITNTGGSFRFVNNHIDSTLAVTVRARNFQFAGNRMRFGSISSTSDSTYITGNVLDTSAVVNLASVSNVLARTYVRDNVFKGHSTSSSTLVVGNTGGGEVSGNRIENSSGHGITLNVTNATLASPFIVSNNFVHVRSASHGIILNGAAHTYLLHNSVNLTGASTSTAAVYSNGGTGITLLNNNLAHQGGGYAIRIDHVSTLKDLNHNNYFTTGTNLGQYNNSNIATLAAWRSATARDGASKNVSPGYLSASNLHTLQTALDSAGTIAQYNPGSGYTQLVATDIDGEARNTARPDIGADEISLAGVDAGVVLITEPFSGPLQAPDAAKTVRVRIKNYGAAPVTAATVNWTVNGLAQAPYSFSGSIASQDTSAAVAIGSMNFVVGSSYTVKAWTSAVNNGSDGNNANDTATVRDVYPALCGTYTVGGTAPHFSDLRSALRTLHGGGQLCAVTLDVRNGTYSDSALVFGVVPGRSSVNTILVRSESGDSSAVILQPLASSNPAHFTNTNVASVIFDKAQYITLQGMTFRYGNNPGGIAPEAMLLFRGSGNKSISLLNNVIDNRASNNRTPGAGIASTGNGSVDSSIVVRNNWLRRVGGISLRSDPDNSSVFSPLLNMPGMLIEGNRIDTAGNGSGIYLKNAIAPVVSGNTLAQGVITLRYVTSPRITGNQVAVTNEVLGGTVRDGISLSNSTNTGAQRALIANNFVSVADLMPANSNVPNGISASGVDQLDVLFNSVLLRHTDNQGYLFQGGGATVRVLNNIFSSPTGSTVFSGSSFQESDRNDLYTTGAIGSGRPTLQSWRTATGYDHHSISVDPFFTSLTDLHAHAGELNEAGIYVPGIMTDIDGNPRGNDPDMGADEFVVPPVDAALTLLAAPVVPYTHGLQPVKVVLKNNGSAPLTAATINWKVSAMAQAPFSYSGNLAPLASDTVTIGTYDFPLGAANPLQVIVSAPGDAFAGNDSLGNSQLWAALNGSYTIGGAAPTFPDFVQAFNQLQKGGVTGPARVAVRNGVYADNLYLNGVPGSGAGKPILFYGESHDRDSVRITGYTTSFSHEYIAVLMNVSYLGFRNISFDNFTTHPSVTQGSVIKAGLDAHHLTFDSCFFRAVQPKQVLATSDAYNLLSFENYVGSTRNADSCTITNNVFVGGGKGVRMVTSNFGAPLRQVTISGNRFLNQQFSSIESGVPVSGTLIEHNRITDTTAFPNYKAVALTGSQASDVRIRNNTVAVSGDGTGIEIVNSFTGTQVDSRIVNNFVQIGSGGASIGIRAYGRWLRVYHNTVHLTSTSAAATAGEFTPDATAGGLQVQNNILANSGGGYAVKVIQSSFGSALQSNYNDLFTTGARTGSWMNTDAASLAAWQSLSGKDVNSRSTDPNFFSRTDLHSRQALLNGAAGILIDIEPADIDGDPRSVSTPDIGADEFGVPNMSVVELVTPANGCTLTGTETVRVKVVNSGSSAQALVPVAYRVNNGPIVRDTIAGPVAAGDTLLYTFPGTADFGATGSYDLKLWTNIIGDSVLSNDTLYTQVHHTRVVSAYPYFEGFEASNGGWFAQGRNSSWAWGVPASANIDSAYGGTKAWKTALAGQHNNDERSYLESPCFNLASFGSAVPKLWFMHAYQIEPVNDSNWVEWSDNGGATWNRMGRSGAGAHWYNGPGNVWQGERKDWELAGFDIPMADIANKSAVRFRIAFATNGSDVRDGVGIDNIFIDTLLPIAQGDTLFTARARSSANGFVDLMSELSERLVQINDSGNNMGVVTAEARITTMPVVHNGVPYLGRHWVITPQAQPTTPVLVRLYFTRAELDSLMARDPSVTSVSDLALYKYDGPAADLDLGNNTGAGQYISAPEVQFHAYGNGYYAEFTVTGFSEFWLTKANRAVLVDMGAQGLLVPAQQSCFGSAEPVRVVVRNYGFATHDFAMHPLTVSAAVSGPHPVTFAPVLINSGSLAAGDTLVVEVASAYDMSAPGSYTFTAGTSVTADSLFANDTMPVTVRTVTALAAGTVSADVSAYCGSGGTPTLTLIGATGYASVQWQESPAGTASWANAGSGATTYTPAVPVGASMQYRALVACGATTDSSNTVSVLLLAPAIDPPANRTFCAGAPAAVSFSGNATSYSWTTSNTAIGLPVSGTGDLSFTAANAGSLPEVATLTVTPFIDGCAGNAVTFSITVNPAPSAAISYAGSPYTTGSGTASVTLSGSTGGTFSSSAGLSLDAATGAINLAGSVPGTYTVTYRIVPAGGCDSFATSTSVQLLEAFVATIAYAGSPYCGSTGIAPVTHSGSTGGTYTASPAGLSIDPATGAINLAASAAGIYTVRYGTVSDFTTTQVSIRPGGQINPLPNSVYCSGQSIPATAFIGSPGFNVTWTNSNTSIGLPAAGSGDLPSFTAVNTSDTLRYAFIRVSATGGTGCSLTPMAYRITVKPLPRVSPVASQELCAGSLSAPVLFSGSFANTLYRWTNNNVATGVGASGVNGIPAFEAVNNSGAAQTSVVTVTPEAAGCTGSPMTFTYTVRPAAGSIVYAGSPYCPTGKVIPSLNGSAGGTYSAPAGLQLNPATGEVNLAYSASGTYTITYSIAGAGVCATTATATITVLPRAAVNTVSNQVHCAGSSVAALAFTGSATSFSWTNSEPGIGLPASGSGGLPAFTATNTGITPLSATIRVVAGGDSTSCGGRIMAFRITVKPTPTVLPPASQVLCRGQLSTQVTFTGSMGSAATYTWTNSSTATGLAATQGRTSVPAFVAENPTSGTVTSIITVTPSADKCFGAPVSYEYTVGNCVTRSAFTGTGGDETAAASVRLHLSPNPTQGAVAIRVTGLGDGPYRVRIVDQFGNSKEPAAPFSGTTGFVSLADRLPGTYVIQVINIRTQKTIQQKVIRL